MRWCPCKDCPMDAEVSQDVEYLCELQRKELFLLQKEKELLKKGKILQRKISKFNKQKKNKASKDLKAAAKLRDARKKLLLTFDNKGKVKTCKKCNKTHARNAKPKQREKRLEKMKRDPRAANCFNGLLSRPCKCAARGNKKLYSKKQDSYLRKIFCLPSSCKNMNTDRTKSPGDFLERAAGDCYSISMGRPPPPWMCNRSPLCYPNYSGATQQSKNCKRLWLFIAGILICTPFLLCLELCKCCFCDCCE